MVTVKANKHIKKGEVISNEIVEIDGFEDSEIIRIKNDLIMVWDYINEKAVSKYKKGDRLNGRLYDQDASKLIDAIQVMIKMVD